MIENEEIQQIINEYENRTGIKKLAKKYKRSRSTIRKILIENNVEIHEPTRQIFEINKNKTTEVIELYENGETYAEISNKTGVKQQSIQTILRRNDVKLRKQYSGGPTVVCKTLRKHHEQLKDDPERLDTKFMLKLIKGE